MSTQPAGRQPLRDVGGPLSTDQRADLGAVAAARDRALGLQRITAALSRAVTTDEVLDVVLTELVAGVGADGAATALLDEQGRSLHVHGAVGYPEDVVHALREFSLDSPLPLALTVRLGRRVVYACNAEMLADNPGMERLVRPATDRAIGAWPLVVADRVIGSVGVSWAGPRPLSDEEVSFVDAVAGQLAQAIDRTRLYEAEAQARRDAEHTASHLALLAGASQILAGTLDLDETLQRLADIFVPRLADWCMVWLRDEHGEPRPVAVSHRDPERVAFIEELQRQWPTRLDSPIGAGLVMRTGRTQVIEEVSDEVLQQAAQDQEHLRVLRRVGIGAGAVVALRIRGRVLGAIAAANDRARPLDRAHVALLEEVAARAAVAVSHAQAFAERSFVATSLQRSLLPVRLPQLPGLEVAARYRAAGTGDVGGDFYDVFPGLGNRWLVAIGDVCGKGVESAALTGLARHTIRCAALHSRSPRRILADLNTMLLRADAEHSGDAAPEPRFCTVCLAAVKAGPGDTTDVTICNAGHPLPMVVRGDGTVTPAGEPGPLLGVFDAPALSERTVHLAPGDTMVWYTDGITERRDGDAYFDDRLAAVLGELADVPADVLAEQLQHEASVFAADAPTDDMAIVVLRHPRVQRP